jgi:pentatricopeptide repeat protein
MYNTIVCFNADAGKLSGAETWMQKLNTQRGIKPEVRSLNNLLISSAKAGEYDKAEEWLGKCGMPALHPELDGLCPTAESYNIMIQMFVNAGELQRAEKWFRAIEADMEVRPTLTSQLGLIRACLRVHESRRAHLWASDLIRNGCPQNVNYAPELVKAERTKFRSTWDWDVAGLIDTVLMVVEALAAAENSHTAHEWLRYLVGCGLKPEEAYGTWEKVRRAHPKEIVSTVLSGEQADPCSPGLPPRTKLASLFGEGARRGSSYRSGATSSMEVSSRTDTSLRTVSSMSIQSTGRRPRSALSDTGRRSGAASPSLRKFLDAKNRGATPSLDWARSETNSPEQIQQIQS